VRRPNSGAGGESAIDTDVEARRIAGELVKLHKAGAIKSEQERFLLCEPDPSLRSQFYCSRRAARTKARIAKPGTGQPLHAYRRAAGQNPERIKQETRGGIPPARLGRGTGLRADGRGTRRERDRSDWRRHTAISTGRPGVFISALSDSTASSGFSRAASQRMASHGKILAHQTRFTRLWLDVGVRLQTVCPSNECPEAPSASE
jgi:hypothetical protein